MVILEIIHQWILGVMCVAAVPLKAQIKGPVSCKSYQCSETIKRVSVVSVNSPDTREVRPSLCLLAAHFRKCVLKHADLETGSL